MFFYLSKLLHVLSGSLQFEGNFVQCKWPTYRDPAPLTARLYNPPPPPPRPLRITRHVLYRKSGICHLSQPPPFSIPLKLLILLCEAKSFSFTVRCVPESMSNYLEVSLTVISFVSTCSEKKYTNVCNNRIFYCKQIQRCG